MKNTCKRFTLLLLALAIAVSMIFGVVPANAATGIDPTESGSIKIDINNQEYRAPLLGSVADVKVYKIANVDGNAVYEGINAFSDIDFSDAANNMTALCDHITDRIESSEIAPDWTLEDLAVIGGTIEFDNAGLYLVCIGTISTGGKNYSFNPILIPMPALGYGGDFEEDGWQYSYTVYLKTEASANTGSLRIRKSLISFITGSTPSFVFDIKAYDDGGQLVYSDVVSLDFDAPGVKEVTVSGIPAGSTVYISEVYSGTRYDAESSEPYVITVCSDDELDDPDNIPTADFINEANTKATDSGSVTNHFEYTGTGWSWTPIPQANNMGGA